MATTEEKLTEMINLRKEATGKHKVSNSTVKSYINVLKVLCKLLKKPYQQEYCGTFIDMFADKARTILGLIDNLSKNTQKQRINALITILDAVNHKYYDKIIKLYRIIRDDLNVQIQDSVNKNTKSARQQENWISLEFLQKEKDYWVKECQAVLDTCLKVRKVEMDMLNCLVCSLLYCGITPPTRREIHNTRVIHLKTYKKMPDEAKFENYFVKCKTRCFLSINDYKTKRKNLDENGDLVDNEVKLYIPLEASILIKKVLKISNCPYYLFPNTQDLGKHMSPAGLSKTVAKTFGRTNKHITPTFIRTIYTTEMFAKNLTLSQKEQLAHMMLTSVDMLESNYKKYDVDNIDILEIESQSLEDEDEDDDNASINIESEDEDDSVQHLVI